MVHHYHLSMLTKEEISKAARELVDLGRVMYALEQYESGHASLGKAAELAGISVNDMMTLLAQFNIKSRIEYSDYQQGLTHLKKEW